MQSPELIKAWLTFFAALSWPVVAVFVVLVFRRQLSLLVERLKSGEVAGAKFSFNETASAFIQAKIDDLAQQSDPKERAVIADEIKGVAAILGSISPVSLAILINAAEPGGQLWSGAAYTSKKTYFEDLERAGFSKTIEKILSGGGIMAELEISDRGRELLHSIGMKEVGKPKPQSSLP